MDSRVLAPHSRGLEKVQKFKRLRQELRVAPSVNYLSLRLEVCLFVNVKRLIVSIIVSAIVGKIFAAAIVHFAENTALTKKSLSGRLFLDRDDSQMNLANIPNNLSIAKPTRAAPLAMKIRSLPVASNTAKKPTNSAKPEEDAAAKKEQERRKKRKKDLEKKNDEVAKKAPPPPQPPLVPVATGVPPETSSVATFSGPPPSTSPGGPTPVATATTPNVMPVGGKTNSGINIAGWLKLLEENPTAALMASFEKLYTSRDITEAQFYQVLDGMETSTNTESRSYSVQGAALYQNINSFKILADESQQESNPQIKTMATSDVDVYASQQDLSILYAALASGDASEKIVAAQLLQGFSTALNQNKSNQQTSRNMLEGFVGVLYSLSSDPNIQVRGTARAALTEIQK